MAFKLTKTEAAQGAAHLDTLEAAGASLNTAIEAFNEALDTLRGEFCVALDVYNGKLNDIREFTGDVAGRLEDELSNKSDKWLESDAGSAAAELRDAWQGLELEDIRIDLPEDIDFEAGDHETALRDLLDSQS